jgi:two-component system phosphate regulon sensor histidine kinase PhoR
VRLGLRGRVAVTALAASAAALLTVMLLVGPGLRRRAMAHEQESLLAEARLMARALEEPLARGEAPEILDPLVDTAAREARARITLIGLDGRVLADSAVSGPALLVLENHGNRPEVQQARVEGAGVAVRHSATVQEDLLYAAVAVRHGERTVGVVRVALSLAGVEEQVRDLETAVAFALLAAFAITGLLSALLAAPLAGPLREIHQVARQFAEGNLQARIRVTRADELGELSTALNTTAERLEQNLSESARERAQTEAILLAMDDGLLAVDQRGTVLIANQALRRFLGLESLVGRHYVESVRQREVDAVIRHVLAFGERREAEVEMPHLHRTFALTGVPPMGDGGAPRGAVLTFHDVTERRRLERIRRDFVANASHELRTPLTSIRGFVEALEDGAIAEPDRGPRFLGKIRSHADRMAALVEDLLELSRLEAGERPPAREEVPPAEIAEDVVASFADQASRKKIGLSHEDGGASPVRSDADRVRRILENLVDNGIKYTAKGGRVTIRSGPGPAGAAIFEVVDSGPGIAAEHLPRLFERFYRVDQARSREMGGTGLGLAIVKHLAESIGASVSVTSEVGQGTRFTVLVPSAPEPPRAS